ncbi:MAG: hypothetical protein DI534_02340 [Leifsonia xyli]|nr:MAG: hypothetical protein DI534_02340 [Leifsonia xyli]
MRGAFVGLPLAVLLSGCDYVLEDVPAADLAVALRDGFVTVTNCGEAMPAPVGVRMGESTDDGFQEFFVAEQDDGWSARGVITSNPDEWARVETSSSPELTGGEQLAVFPQFGTGGTVARFTIPKRGIPDDGWLHPDGTITIEPCPRS